MSSPDDWRLRQIVCELHGASCYNGMNRCQNKQTNKKYGKDISDASPGSSFLTNNSESEKDDALESEPQPLDGPLADEGGATSEEDRVTASLRIFKASFQWTPLK